MISIEKFNKLNALQSLVENKAEIVYESLILNANQCCVRAVFLQRWGNPSRIEIVFPNFNWFP